MSQSYSRLRFGVAVGVAFVCGLVFASGFDLTRFGYAQSSRTPARTTSAPAPSLPDPTSNAFVTISERLTPAVVSITAERDARARQPRNNNNNQNNRRVPPGL